MAVTKTRKQATKVETPATEEKVSVVRPEDLAKELGVSGKKIRAWLRKTYKDQHELRTSWLLTPKQADAVREHFSRDDEDEGEE